MRSRPTVCAGLLFVGLTPLTACTNVQGGADEQEQAEQSLTGTCQVNAL